MSTAIPPPPFRAAAAAIAIAAASRPGGVAAPTTISNVAASATSHSSQLVLMVKPEKRLGVVVEDLVGIGFGEAQPLDVSKGLLIGLVILQHRIVAAGHEV